jgi:glutamate carboxypeptidase
LDRGITVNVGTVQGGTRSNVVAAEARAEVDVRIAKAKDEARVEKHFRSLRVFDNRCSLHVEGGLNRPPMERTRGTVALFKRAAKHARTLGFVLEEAATGGGSDGNFTSALGVPTLDGMGAVGEGAHALHESLLLEHMAPRTALLAAMLADAGEWGYMLKFVEFGLLAVSLLIIFGLVASSPRGPQPTVPEIAEAGDAEISPLHKL